MLKSFVNLAAAAAFFVAAAPAVAQVQTVDPNQPDAWQSAPAPAAEEPAPADTPEFTPVEQPPAAAAPEASPAPPAGDVRTATTEQANTVPREDVFSAAEGVFGRGAQGLAHLLENVLRDQGEPVAYIAGSEAGGAFVFGVRYGSGVMHHSIEGDRTVYWTGPSLGFDAGADANKVFVLVYNLHDSQDLFRRYPHAEGHAYFIGGFNAQYMRRGDVVLIPIRLGVGMRLGVNAGYMRFSERNRWLPF
ncbi:MAG TPA: DUF1134 domain-containing protein [Allosphingosinicella sp.]|nr:DUF1134 domain-containing protein [Allosphingosinicella sp.]